MTDTLPASALARLQELEDRAEISDMVIKYGKALRTGDVDLVCSLFAADAVIEHGHGTMISGADAIRAHFGGASERSAVARAVLTFDETLARTPVMADTLVTVDGDTAHCESTCFAIHGGLRDGQTFVIVRGTRNIDELVRTPQGWKIRHRTHPAMWKFEVPAEVYGNGESV